MAFYSAEVLSACLIAWLFSGTCYSCEFVQDQGLDRFVIRPFFMSCQVKTDSSHVQYIQYVFEGLYVCLAAYRQHMYQQHSFVTRPTTIWSNLMSDLLKSSEMPATFTTLCGHCRLYRKTCTASLIERNQSREIRDSLVFENMISLDSWWVCSCILCLASGRSTCLN